MEVILYLEIQIKTSPYFCIFHNLKVLGTHKNLLSHCKFHENRRQFQKCTSHILLLLDLGENRYKRFEYNFFSTYDFRENRRRDDRTFLNVLNETGFPHVL